jgi:hypothetical protein
LKKGVSAQRARTTSVIIPICSRPSHNNVSIAETAKIQTSVMTDKKTLTFEIARQWDGNSLFLREFTSIDDDAAEVLASYGKAINGSVKHFRFSVLKGKIS